MQSHFFAYINRLNLINRWQLMATNRNESVAAHTMMTATIAHCLATVTNTLYGGNVDVGRVTQCALFHDATEVLTGDMPTPIKYANPALLAAYKGVEKEATDRMIAMLPTELRPAYLACLDFDDDPDVYPYVKAADTLSAYIKCIEEVNLGNRDFSVALESTKTKLDAIDLPAVRYFVETFLPSLSLPLDSLR